ncbi:hypothetical protein [Neisseria iguanae]|uniref:hypothetical protein n=1 Tax=Neisseria iguanae TaxID=90242 RepID=UPI001B804C2D|nr:hypothetical protein [Neisseria iguanae]
MLLSDGLEFKPVSFYGYSRNVSGWFFQYPAATKPPPVKITGTMAKAIMAVADLSMTFFRQAV